MIILFTLMMISIGAVTAFAVTGIFNEDISIGYVSLMVSVTVILLMFAAFYSLLGEDAANNALMIIMLMWNATSIPYIIIALFNRNRL